MFKYNKNAYHKQKSERITFQEIVSLVAARTGSNPKLNGRSYVANCPAHNDKHASLSIGQAEDGKILLYCFASCPIELICASLGIEVKNLFPSKNRGAYRG